MSAPWVVYGRGAGARWVPVAAIPVESRRRPGRSRAGEPRPFGMEALERATRGGTLAEVAELLGVSYRTVLRLRRDGLSVYRADEYAGRAGLHPMEVWTTWPGR